jgi:hypothetical protein
MLSRTPPAADWSAELSRPIALKTGRTLASLSDARACLIETFANVVRDEGLALAIALLMKAAETGKPKDRRAATDQIELILRHRGVLAGSPVTQAARKKRR